MAEPEKAAPQATASMIHDEAFRARIASESILEKLTGPKDDKEPDPVAELLTAIREVLSGQTAILRRLDGIERKLDTSRQPRASGTP
jgi:hypothetical protein